MGVALRGDASSGRTTLALRLAAEAQAAGSIVAWLDLAAALDPVEAVARGVELAWLVVVTPADAEEGLAIAGSLLAGRAVDLLVIDLPASFARGPGARGTGANSAIGSDAWQRSRAVPGSRSSCSSRRGRPVARASRPPSARRPASGWSWPVDRGSGSAGTSSASERR